jgi:hypothetical protein
MPDRRQLLRNSSTQHLPKGGTDPFSPAGFEQLRYCIEEYIDALTGESERIAKRAQADTISRAHVEDASRHLLSLTGRRFFRHLGTIGGILLGTALAQAVAMISSTQVTVPGVALSVGLGIIGAFLVAFHIAKD